jgi:hypothetical protein
MMNDKIAIVAVIIAGLSLLLVLLAPAPKHPSRDSLREVERIVLMVGSEQNALFEEQAQLKGAFEIIEQMRRRFAKSPENTPDPNAFAADVTKKELVHRKPEFVERLKVISEYKKLRAGGSDKRK